MALKTQKSAKSKATTFRGSQTFRALDECGIFPCGRNGPMTIKFAPEQTAIQVGGADPALRTNLTTCAMRLPAAPKPTAWLRFSRRTHRESITILLYHKIWWLSRVSFYILCLSKNPCKQTSSEEQEQKNIFTPESE